MSGVYIFERWGINSYQEMPKEKLSNGRINDLYGKN